MKRMLTTALAATLAAAAAAAPQIAADSVTFSQDAATRRVTIGYELAGDEPAIVTIGVATNDGSGAFVSIGAERLARFSGDVNRVVAAGGARTAYWQADAAWPDQTASSAHVTLTVWSTNAPPPYLALDLAAKTQRYYASAAEIPGGDTNRIYKSSMLLLRRIPAAGVTWQMGAASADECGKTAFEGDEKPHDVTLSSDYYFSVYPVTQRQYYLLHENAKYGSGTTYSDIPGGKSPSAYTGADADYHPVENICYTYLYGSTSWPASGYDIGSGDAARLMARARRITGLRLSLPTEAQWEFAARAGVSAAYRDGTSTWKDALGWTKTNADYDGQTREVGLTEANAWGIYDVHGNVWEICLDWYDSAYYAASPAADPPGPASSSANQRVARGGGFSSPATSARFAKRGYAVNNVVGNNAGFRLVCPAVATANPVAESSAAGALDTRDGTLRRSAAKAVATGRPGGVTIVVK